MKKGTIFALIAATAAVAAGAAYVLSQKKKGCCGCDYDGGDLDGDCDGCGGCSADSGSTSCGVSIKASNGRARKLPRKIRTIPKRSAAIYRKVVEE